MKIEIISASTREGSHSYKEALFLYKHLRDQVKHEVGLIDVRENPLPSLEKVFVSADMAPDAFKPLAERMFAAEAFILVTPEYNGSYSAALKNLFDHFPKQVHKTFGIVTASAGPMGGMRATQQLQLFINALFGIASPYMIVTPFVDKKFDDEGNLLDGSFQANVDNFVAEFLWLAEKTSQPREHAGF